MINPIDDYLWPCGRVLFFLTAVAEQAKANNAKAKAILSLYERMKAELPEVVSTQFAIRAIDALFDRPIFKSGDFIERSRIPRASAMRILQALQGHGILSVLRPAGGRRAAILMFRELLSITEGRNM